MKREILFSWSVFNQYALSYFWPFDTVWIEGAGRHFNTTGVTSTSENDSILKQLVLHVLFYSYHCQRVCVFVSQGEELCLCPPPVCNNEWQTGVGGEGGEEERIKSEEGWKKEMKRREELLCLLVWLSWNVSSLDCQSICLSHSLSSIFFSVSSFVHFLLLSSLKQSPALFSPFSVGGRLCCRSAVSLDCQTTALSLYQSGY